MLSKLTKYYKDIIIVLLPFIVTSIVLFIVFFDVNSTIESSKFKKTENIIKIENMSKLCIRRENFLECIQNIEQQDYKVKVIKRKDGTYYLEAIAIGD